MNPCGYRIIKWCFSQFVFLQYLEKKGERKRVKGERERRSGREEEREITAQL